MFHACLNTVLKVYSFVQIPDISLLIAVKVVSLLSTLSTIYSSKESLTKMRNEEYEFQNVYKINC